jgi:hypothetical protein
MARSFRPALALVVALGAPASHAAPCAGFSDVDTASGFCKNIEWIRNRGVTTGCGTNVYCPLDFVTREQMAAFMNRLGTALTPTRLYVDNVIATGQNLGSGIMVCQTVDFAVTDYPRTATMHAVVSGGVSVDVTLQVVPMYSTNAGASWNAFGGAVFASAGPAAGNAAYTAPVVTQAFNLAVGTSYRFALALSRNAGGAVVATAGNSTCQLAVDIRSRTGASSPFDESP